MTDHYLCFVRYDRIILSLLLLASCTYISRSLRIFSIENLYLSLKIV